MIPIRLSIKNFLSYRDNVPVLDLEDVHVACLSGDNGHGKSALLDAITWALWGTARARVQEDLVYQGENEMRVDLEFEANDDRYRVVRRFARALRGRQGATFLELFYSTSAGFQPVTGNSVRETEAKIRSLLRMDYDTFVNSSFILQGRADMFTTSTPSKRKELLGEILNLSWYEHLAEKARALTREQENSRQLLEMEIKNIDNELSRKEEYQTQLDTIVGDLNDLEIDLKDRGVRIYDLQVEIQRLENLKQELVGLEREEKHILNEITWRDSHVGKQRKRLAELQLNAERLPKLEDDLIEVHDSLAGLTTSSHSIEEKRLRLQDLQSRMLHIRETNTALKSEMDDLRVKVDLLQESSGPDGVGARCPLCGEDLGEEGCQRLAANYETQGIEKANIHRENDASIHHMDFERVSLDQELVSMESNLLSVRQEGERRRDLLFKAVESARAAGDMVAQLAGALDSDELSLHINRERLQEVQLATPPLKKEIFSMSGVLDAQNEEKLQIDTLRARQERSIEDRGLVQGHLERCREFEIRRAERDEAFSNASYRKGVYDQLSVAFGKSGIQALLIEQALPELEMEANSILARVSDSRMGLKLETQRERRGGGDPRETLDIKISDELGFPRSYETYSGGEAFRINFALRIALSKLLAHRSGAPLPTLFIDEGFGTQDAFGLEKLVEAIKVIEDDFQKIIVITHIEEIKEAFPVRIEVTKTSKGSTFTVI